MVLSFHCQTALNGDLRRKGSGTMSHFSIQVHLPKTAPRQYGFNRLIIKLITHIHPIRGERRRKTHPVRFRRSCHMLRDISSGEGERPDGSISDPTAGQRDHGEPDRHAHSPAGKRPGHKTDRSESCGCRRERPPAHCHRTAGWETHTVPTHGKSRRIRPGPGNRTNRRDRKIRESEETYCQGSREYRRNRGNRPFRSPGPTTTRRGWAP